jgi:hypothetical protein
VDPSGSWEGKGFRQLNHSPKKSKQPSPKKKEKKESKRKVSKNSTNVAIVIDESPGKDDLAVQAKKPRRNTKPKVAK